MQTIRTFIAVTLSKSIRAQTLQLGRVLKQSDASVKWVDVDQLHVTLKFLGDVLNTKVPSICPAVKVAASCCPPFEVGCQGAGAFPKNDRPRTVWAGIGPGSEELGTLYEAIESELVAIGVPAERRRFHPHVTLGRVRQGGAAQQRLGELIQSAGDFETDLCPVREVTVFASFLDKSGPTYDVLGRATLGG